MHTQQPTPDGHPSTRPKTNGGRRFFFYNGMVEEKKTEQRELIISIDLITTKDVYLLNGKKIYERAMKWQSLLILSKTRAPKQ